MRKKMIYMGASFDLTGKRFGKLIAIKPVCKNGKRHWYCTCDCGGHSEVITSSLTHGITRSCGCNSGKKVNTDIRYHSVNEYEFTVDTCIGYTSKSEKFLVDIEDFDKIQNYSWHFNNQGYLVTNIQDGKKQKKIKIYRLIMNCPSDKMVDHKRGKQSRFDNRKENLRVCNNQENQMNKPPSNKLGVKGVSITHCNTYQAQIQIDGVLKYLGSYRTIKEAADAYDKAAKEFFGDFAWLNNYEENRQTN